MIRFFLATAAIVTIMAPANATITADGPTTARIIRDMNACETQTYNADFNKMRADFDACIRGIDGWTDR